MKIQNNTINNKFGYFMFYGLLLLEVGAIYSLLFQNANDQIVSVVLMILLAPFLMYLAYPWMKFKRTLYIDLENKIIKNVVGYREQTKERVYQIDNIVDYNVSKFLETKEMRENDPTLIIPANAKSALTTYVGYIQFEESEYLVMFSGTRKKVKKKMQEIEDYIEGESKV